MKHNIKENKMWYWWVLGSLLVIGICVIDICLIASGRIREDDFEDQLRAIEEWKIRKE